MRMPEVDGPTFLKSVRDDIRLHKLRVFTVSGSSRNEFEPNSLVVDGWFSKPVRIDSLLQAVRSEQTPATVTV
jgi:CheY-like chemotaxis protein